MFLRLMDSAKLVLLTLLVLPAAAAERQLTLSYFDSPFQNLHVDIMAEAYQGLDIDVKFINLPSKRALVSSSKGLVDGETNRIGKIKAKFPSLIQIPIPMHPLVGAAYSLDGNLNIKHWQDLKPYRVGVLQGVPFYEKPTQGMNRLYANNYKQLFELLVRGRVDVVVGTTFSSEQTINQQFADAGIIQDGSVLIHIETFHYLHQKNSDLVPAITRALQQMRDSGRIDQIVADNLH
ncbi:MAG: transporter substrate-binding domain-containing protein [Halopseudomonas sp.]